MRMTYLVLSASSVFAQRIFLPKPAPKPYQPPKPNLPENPPKVPKPTNVKPVDKPDTPQQDVIQTNMAALEEKAATDGIGRKFAEELVQAIQGSVMDDLRTLTYFNPSTGK